MNEEQITNIDINSIKRKLLVKYPSFGSIIANTNFQEELTIETAGTDGEYIYYNPTFINGLTEEQKTFLFAHEVCHIAFDHIFRSEGKDSELWNIATDSVINAYLQKDGLPLIKGGIDIPDAINHDAEEMYKELLAKKQQNKNSHEQNSKGQEGKQSGGSSSSNNQEDNKQSNSQQTSSNLDNEQQNSNSNENNDTDNKKQQTNDVGHDTHSLWGKAIERKKEQENRKDQESKNPKKLSNNRNQEEPQKKEENKKSKNSLLDKLFNRNKKQQSESKEKKQEQEPQKKQENKEQKRKEEQIKKIAELGEKKVFKQNRIERKKQLEELRKTLVEQSHGIGTDTNEKRREVSNIGVATSLIDWRRLLKEAVKIDVDWSYKNASIEDGVVTPYLEEIPQPETEILLDTSGSIDETLLRNFLRECKNILQTSKVKVGCFDTKFYGFNEIKNINDIDNIELKGGGGTNFDTAVNAFSRRVENKIIFTDGWSSMPSKSIDAIWIVFGNREINPKGGKIIYISDEQLRKLCSYMNNNSYKGRKR